MTEIGQNNRSSQQNFPSGPEGETIRDVFRRNAGLADAGGKTVTTKGGDVGSRRVYDTVELTGSAQKIVNLQRGNDLAQEARTRTVNQDFAKFLGESAADIRRIGKLFNGTFVSFFNQLRGRS